MQDQPVVGVFLELFRDKFKQFLFYFQDILADPDTGTVGDTEDMRIDCDGWLTEGCIQDHVRRFSTDTRQFFQGLSVLRDFSLMPLN